jgi:hypothetical protein
MWVDFSITIYSQSKCDKDIFVYFEELNFIKGDKDKTYIGYWIGYKIMVLIPTLMMCSYISIILTYRAVYMMMKLIRDKQLKSFFDCERDVTENIYSHSDILYILDLFKGSKLSKENYKCNKTVLSFTRFFGNLTNIKYQYNSDLEIKSKSNIAQRFKSTLKNVFKFSVYDWKDNFRFTSRFINMHVVALTTLYHINCAFFLFILMILKYSKDFVEIINEILESFDIDYKFKIPVSLMTVLFVPFFVSLLISAIQVLKGMSNTKKHLLEVYKGKCVYLPPSSTLSNSSIASNSFHYGGYLTAYLIWGFVIQFIFILLLMVIIVIIFALIREPINLLNSGLMLLVPIIVKKIIEFFAAEIIFINKTSRILAINNFRAYNVFLYFNFFYDCFMGFISALLRIFIALLASIFYMPRISYSFMGRELENFDNGKCLFLPIYLPFISFKF